MSKTWRALGLAAVFIAVLAAFAWGSLAMFQGMAGRMSGGMMGAVPAPVATAAKRAGIPYVPLPAHGTQSVAWQAPARAGTRTPRCARCTQV